MAPALVLLFSLPARAGEEEPAIPWDEVADHPERLIPLLGHDAWKVREKATVLLDRLGEKALPALQKARKSHDPEIAMRAERLARLIEQQVRMRGFKPVIRSHHQLATVWSSKRAIVRDRAGALYAALLCVEPEGILRVLKSRNRGETWTSLPSPGFQSVDPKGFSLAIDGKDHLLLVVHDQKDSNHFFLREFDGKEWLPKERCSDQACGGGRSPALAVDGEDNLHVVWQEVHGETFYRKKSGKGWQAIEAVGNLGAQTGIAVGPENAVHIVGGYRGSRLRYRRRGAEGWGPLEVVDTSPSSRHGSIAVDSKGRPHIAWTGNGYAEGWRIFYRMKTEKGWTPRKIVSASRDNPGDEKYHNPTLAVDEKDNVIIVYDGGMPDGNTLIFFVKKTGAAWSKEAVLTVPEARARYPQLRWSFWPPSNRVKGEGDLDLLITKLADETYQVLYRNGLKTK
jgi:hypothetical protein